MQRLTCEMCNSTDVLKQDGMFVCQSCGTKYSVEEAKKMMIEGTVDVQGIVKVDTTDDLTKLYQAARNARETGDGKSALMHYEKISAMDPNSWEALFYLVILKTESIKNAEIQSTAISVESCLPKVISLVSTNIQDENEKKKALQDIVDNCRTTAIWLTSASHSFYKSITKGNGMMALTGLTGALSSLSSTGEAIGEDKNRRASIGNMIAVCGNLIESNFDMEDKEYQELCIKAWKTVLELDESYQKDHNQHLYVTDTLIKYSTKIHNFDPSYEIYSNSSSGGCYVATCVYGSYDCPQVWTLRRYRDNTLASTWYGRAFIHTYYAISPSLVKWFGHTKWFKKMWQGKLDKMVEKLQSEGVESTPYKDKNW